MSALVPCLACARHIRTSEHACPFCGAEAPESAQAAAPVFGQTGRRLSRAALVLGSVAVAACGKDLTPSEPSRPDATTEPARLDAGGMLLMYGAPPIMNDAAPPSTPPPSTPPSKR